MTTTTSTDTYTNLRLVTVSESYDGWPGEFPRDQRSQTFFAHDPEGIGVGYSRLILPADVGRAVGFYVSASSGDGRDHVGWNVPRGMVTDVTPDPEPPATGDRFAVGSRHTMSAGAHVGEGDAIVLEEGTDATSVGLRYGCGVTDTVARVWLEANSTPREPVAAPVAAPEPVAEETAPPEPYRAAEGDRVRVIRDGDSPSQQGKAATVLEHRPGIGAGRIRVRYDEGSSSSHTSDYGWWVDEVEPLMPATVEEFTARLEAARLEGLEQGKREGVATGREQVTAEVEEWKREATATAHDYAQRNGLCSEFDRCMVAIGLEPRDTYSRYVDVELTYSVRVEVSGSELIGDEDDRENIALERAVSQIREGYADPYNTDVDWD